MDAMQIARGVLSCYGGLPFLFVLSIVVFFHELGHFLVARWCGVRVLVFSIGFGPELIGFNDRHGTRWKISAIPLGGYVKFFGDENSASVPDQAAVAAMTPEEQTKSLFHKSVGQRSAIVFAGPFANFLLAIAIFSVLLMVVGKRSEAARVDTVLADSAAAAAGFQPGDLVLSINGRPIGSFSEMQRIVSLSAGETLTVVVDRGGVQMTLKATPTLREMKDNFGSVMRVGQLGISRSMAPEDLQYQTVGPIDAIGMGVAETWFVLEQTLGYIAGVIGGRQSAEQLGGPIRIAEVSCQVAAAGIAALFSLTAILSISIGLLNLFPVPLLDGGHLLFYAIEAVRGKPLSERTQEMGFRIGFALVIMLMLFATFNDISGILRRIVS